MLLFDLVYPLLPNVRFQLIKEFFCDGGTDFQEILLLDLLTETVGAEFFVNFGFVFLAPDGVGYA